MSDQVIVAVIGAISALIGAIIQAQSASASQQSKNANLRQIFFGALIGLIFGVAVGLVVANFINPSRPTMSSMEYDTDRQGEDYAKEILPTTDPKKCESKCADELRCKAWTYVAPGFQDNSGPVCYLKTSPASAKPNICCISGFKDSK